MAYSTIKISNNNKHPDSSFNLINANFSQMKGNNELSTFIPLNTEMDTAALQSLLKVSKNGNSLGYKAIKLLFSSGELFCVIWRSVIILGDLKLPP